MLARLQDLRIRTQLFLLSGIMIAGFIIFGIMCFVTIGEIRVNGPVYKDIVRGKDLIGDILPPPEYVVESYLTVMQANDAKDAQSQKAFMEKLNQLHKEYDERHAFWEKELPEGPMKETLIKKSYESAVAFYDKVEKEFFPAVIAHDTARVETLKGELAKVYETHRTAIDEVVKLANESDSAGESFAAHTIWTMVALLIIIAGITILASCSVALFTIRAITRSLTGAMLVSEEIAEGNLGVTIEARSTNEAGRLLGAMKKMVESMRATIEGVKSSAASVATASEQLSASSRQMSTGLSEQSGKVSQVSSASTEMAQTVTDIARNASHIAAAATETSTIAKNGSDIVDKSVEEVKAIATNIDSSARVVASLGERSRQIGDIIDVIKGIADQTNLLALNAAIEAARAGDQGRGFAVVADEVRKLAERTTQATAEIGEMIGAIQKEVDEAVGSMGDTTEHVATGVADVTKAGETLARIVESADNLQLMVQQIATATEEMSAVSQSINSDIEMIANVSQETSAGSSQIAQAASDLARLSSTLIQAVGHFRA